MTISEINRILRSGLHRYIIDETPEETKCLNQVLKETDSTGLKQKEFIRKCWKHPNLSWIRRDQKLNELLK